MSEIVDVKNIRISDSIAIEINTIKEQTMDYMLRSSFELGKKLLEAKELVGHGEWGEWLVEKVDFKKSTANNLMNIYENYSDKSGKFANLQTFGNLTYSKAVALLSLPEEEREIIAEKVDIEDVSVKKLKSEIEKLKKGLAEEEKSSIYHADRANENKDEARELAKQLVEKNSTITSVKEEKENALKELNVYISDRNSDIASAISDKQKELEKLKSNNIDLEKNLDDVKEKMKKQKDKPSKISTADKKAIADEATKELEAQIELISKELENTITDKRSLQTGIERLEKEASNTDVLIIKEHLKTFGEVARKVVSLTKGLEGEKYTKISVAVLASVKGFFKELEE